MLNILKTLPKVSEKIKKRFNKWCKLSKRKHFHIVYTFCYKRCDLILGEPLILFAVPWTHV